ncbi:MAG: hypothetical protein EPN36_14295 [Rhodanobacteraceae bacterium]|nr:MAG: hypothetical protein EPN36_14295 [Rhodanobacteraceae bacterium]
MGGSALSVATQRIDAAAYAKMGDRVIAWLDRLVPGGRATIVPSYRGKPDFGDMDVLIEREALQHAGGPDMLVHRAGQDFGSRAHRRNGHVTSVEYRDHDDRSVQLDLISAPAATFAFELAYLSWNDLGNLIGRIAHRMGFRYGMDGLVYMLRDGDHAFATVTVTTNVPRALDFLGYDPDRFNAGFDTMEDIFAYTASSRFFAPELYLLENRNHTSRTRDRKRKTYSAFLDWLAAGKAPAADYRHAWADRDDSEAVETERMAFVIGARNRFPAFACELDKALSERRMLREVHERLNGRLVAQWTGLEDRKLGALMRRLNDKLGSTERKHAWLMAATTAQVQAFVYDTVDEAGIPDT